MERNGVIELVGMEFLAFHGCLEEERRNGNLFVVDFRGTVDMAAAAESDDLSDTEDYGVLYGIIRDEMAKPSNLLEHVAGRIVRAVEERMPGFAEFSVTVSKKNPPVGGVCAWSKITMGGGASSPRNDL